MEVVKSLLKLGPDLYCRSDTTGSDTTGLSILREILEPTNDPYDASKTFKFWAAILNTSGIDLTSYLKVELELFNMENPKFIRERFYRQRYITMEMDIYGQPVISWDWWVDPEAPGFEVVREFRDFEPPFGLLSDHHYNPEEFCCDWREDFPYVCLMRHVREEHEPSKEDLDPSLESTRDLREQHSQFRLWNIRGESRRQKKADKLAKAMGLGGRQLHLPGAWID